MTAKPTILVLLDRTSLQLARQTPHGVETSDLSHIDWTQAESLVREIAAGLDAWNIRRATLVIGLQSALCISSYLSLPGTKAGRQRQALYYLLEPMLPWPAEEIIADFECSKTDAFGVAVLAEPIIELVQRLEEAGLRVESVTPVARLALSYELSQNAACYPPRFLFLWGDGTSSELWLIDRKRPLMWRQVELNRGVILQELKQIALAETDFPPLVVRNLPQEWIADISSVAKILAPQRSGTDTNTLLESALHTAVNIGTGSQTASIEFRRDQLAGTNRWRSIQSSLRAVQIALHCLLIATGFALYQWGELANDRRRESASRQSDLFRKLFPEAQVPVGVRSRLESEHAKLASMRGDVVELPESLSAVSLLERLLGSLPRDLRYRILEIRVEEGRMYVVGQVREHADADRIAEELRKAQLLVESPSTHRLPQKGVEFRISTQIPLATQTTQERPL